MLIERVERVLQTSLQEAIHPETPPRLGQAIVHAVLNRKRIYFGPLSEDQHSFVIMVGDRAVDATEPRLGIITPELLDPLFSGIQPAAVLGTHTGRCENQQDQQKSQRPH